MVKLTNGKEKPEPKRRRVLFRGSLRTRTSAGIYIFFSERRNETMAQLFMRFPGGVQRALTLSYDDGVEQDARLIEIMKKYGLK